MKGAFFISFLVTIIGGIIIGIFLYPLLEHYGILKIIITNN